MGGMIEYLKMVGEEQQKRGWKKFNGTDMLYFPDTTHEMFILLKTGQTKDFEEEYHLRFGEIKKDEKGGHIEISYEDYRDYCNFLYENKLCDIRGISIHSENSESMVEEWEDGSAGSGSCHLR